MSPGFAIVLLGALAVAGVLSYLQHRAYTASTRRLVDRFRSNPRAVIVSGRGKGWSRGAVVLLAIDSSSRRVIAGEAMVGASVFARFHPREELEGPLASVASRTTDRKLGQALEQAVEQYRSVRQRSGAVRKYS
jgi:DNA-binding transcriptional regulator of glucitol operon